MFVILNEKGWMKSENITYNMKQLVALKENSRTNDDLHEIFSDCYWHDEIRSIFKCGS